jgi:hypothetical protein
MKGDYRDLVLPPGTKVLTTRLPAEFGGPADHLAEVSKVIEPASRARPEARYTKPGEDGLNKTERAFGEYLEARKRAGEIYDWRAQAWKLLIVPGVPKSDDTEGVKAAWYTPDNVVFENDGSISFYEVKGYLDQSGDGWLKFKAAVALWPFPFYLVRKVSKVKGSWDIERYSRVKEGTIG